MSSADVTTGPSLDVGKLRLARTASDDEMTNRDIELIRRIREFGAWLGEHGDALDEALNQISVETLVPALRHLARVVRRMGMEPRLSAELRAALVEMDAAQ